MSAEDWVNFPRNVGNSAKRSSDAAVGKYGLGATTAYHLTDVPQVTALHLLLTLHCPRSSCLRLVAFINSAQHLDCTGTGMLTKRLPHCTSSIIRIHICPLMALWQGDEWAAVAPAGPARHHAAPRRQLRSPPQRSCLPNFCDPRRARLLPPQHDGPRPAGAVPGGGGRRQHPAGLVPSPGTGLPCRPLGCAATLFRLPLRTRVTAPRSEISTQVRLRFPPENLPTLPRSHSYCRPQGRPTCAGCICPRIRCACATALSPLGRWAVSAVFTASSAHTAAVKPQPVRVDLRGVLQVYSLDTLRTVLHPAGSCRAQPAALHGSVRNISVAVLRASPGTKAKATGGNS